GRLSSLQVLASAGGGTAGRSGRQMDLGRSVLHILIHFLLHESHRAPAEWASQQPRVRFLCSRRAERVHRRFEVQGAVAFAGAELHRDRSFCCPASGKAGGKPTAMCGDSEWRQTPPQQSSAGGCLLPRGFGRYRSKSIVNMRARPQVFLAAQNAKAGGQRRVWFVTVTANEDSVWGRALVRRLSSSRRSKSPH